MHRRPAAVCFMHGLPVYCCVLRGLPVHRCVLHGLPVHCCVHHSLLMHRCACIAHACVCLQVWVGVVSVGPSGHPLNSSYQCRDDVRCGRNAGSTHSSSYMPPSLLIAPVHTCRPHTSSLIITHDTLTPHRTCYAALTPRHSSSHMPPSHLVAHQHACRSHSSPRLPLHT